MAYCRRRKMHLGRTIEVTTMHAHSAKQDAIHAIERLPDDVPLDEIVYRLYVLNKVQQGLQDIDAGRTIRSEELAQEIEAW
jgi:predicted transcriptional regulator